MHLPKGNRGTMLTNLLVTSFTKNSFKDILQTLYPSATNYLFKLHHCSVVQLW